MKVRYLGSYVVQTATSHSSPSLLLLKLTSLNLLTKFDMSSIFSDLWICLSRSHNFRYLGRINNMKLTIATLVIGSAAAFSTSSFSGSALKASANDATMKMEATGMGVNGFGRIGRLGKLTSAIEIVVVQVCSLKTMPVEPDANIALPFPPALVQ